MDELVRALGARLPPGSVRLKARVTDVARAGGGWRVGTQDGDVLAADGVIVATEAHQAARLLRYLDPSLALLLEGIPYASSATVTLAYRRAAVRHPLDGFGFVVPHAEGRPIIAGTFSSVKYPGRAPDGHVLLRVFLGGALREAVLEQDDDAPGRDRARAVARSARRRRGAALGRASRAISKAMPQYHVGHLARVETIERAVARHPGLALAGGAYRGVGIADCVHSGEDAARALLER